MLDASSQMQHYGNLFYYKYYLRPTAHLQYGNSTKTKTKHQQNVQNLLQVLFQNGTSTTWDMAKIKHSNDVSATRTKEKEYRRLLIGRTDRGKHSPGIIDLGLVIRDGKKYKRGIPSDQYRLSMHGILYCLDVLNLNYNDIDKMAAKYANVAPKIFGKWEYLRTIIGDDIYKIKILSKGLLLDTPSISKKQSGPLYELMSYINIKYRNFFESISEEDLAEQISLWFYTYLLYQRKESRNKKLVGVQKLQHIFERDDTLREWYLKYFKEAEKYYNERTKILKISGIF